MKCFSLDSSFLFCFYRKTSLQTVTNGLMWKRSMNVCTGHETCGTIIRFNRVQCRYEHCMHGSRTVRLASALTCFTITFKEHLKQSNVNNSANSELASESLQPKAEVVYRAFLFKLERCGVQGLPKRPRSSGLWNSLRCVLSYLRNFFLSLFQSPGDTRTNFNF